MYNYDIVICSLPPFPINEIVAAPALLKACAESHGYTARTLDLSQHLYVAYANRSLDQFAKLSNIFYPYIKHSLMSADDQNTVDQFIKDSAEQIINLNTNWVGLSVFSSFTHKSTYLLCRQLKLSKPDIKIVVGGRGVAVPVNQVKVDLGLPTASADTITPFYKYLLDERLIDRYIIGDGEDAIIDVIENKDQKLFAKQQTADILSLPVPNFDDYKFDDYVFNGNQRYLPVTGSKGCVRNCEFCDVKKQFGRFRFRSGKDVANELIEVQRRYNVSQFFLNDSLVNGSLKAFTEFLEILAEHNLSNPDRSISWFGQYITRPVGQTPEKIYQLISKSGGQELIIGAESGSNDVLRSINKKNTVEDLYAELELFQAHGIACRLNIISGYWSETWNNFLETVDMFKKLHPYVLSGTVASMAIGFPLVLYPETPLWDKLKEYKIHPGPQANDASHSWYSEKNPRLTLKERYHRKIILEKIAIALKYPIGDLTESHDWIVKYLHTNTKPINEFQQIILSNS
jgi:radical SAM superfamily enzyme YgiQ (UPF0313 family)